MAVMSDFSTFSQMTYQQSDTDSPETRGAKGGYRDPVGVLLSDPLSLGLAFLERVFVLEFGAHICVKSGSEAKRWAWKKTTCSLQSTNADRTDLEGR